MIERSRLFLIIALGETVLTTGTALSTAHINAATVIAAGLAVLNRSPVGSLLRRVRSTRQ